MSNDIPTDIWLLLTRHYAGESSAEERAELERWIGDDEERRKWVESVRTLIQESTLPMPETDSQASFARARAYLGLEMDSRPTVAVRAYQQRPPRRPVAVYSPLWWRAVGGSVAGIVLLIMSGRFLRQDMPSTQAYATAPGQRLTVTLSDGTQMTLGPESRVRLARNYGSGSRSVELEGEGFFTVVHDAKRPFTVHVQGAVATDIGTAFDIRGYSGDDAPRLVVMSGEVAFGRAGCVMGTCVADVRPGDVAMVGDYGVTVHHRDDVSMYDAWRQNGLVFEDTPLRTVVQDIARAYGLSITIADSTLATKPVTARFAGQSADFVLNAITQVLGARYERNGGHVVIRKGTTTAQQPKVAAPPPLTTARGNN